MTSSTLNFPRFLLPAFPRWESSLLKRNRPVEDVTEQPAATTALRRPSSNLSSHSLSTTSASSSEEEEGEGEELQDPPARHERILSHDSGCIFSDDEDDEDADEDEEEEEHGVLEVGSSEENGRTYAHAPSRPVSSSSADSMEIYLDTESGYGGSTDELPISPLNGASSSSVPQLHHQTIPSSSKGRFAFWPRSRKSFQPAPPAPALSTTTTYLNCLTCRTNLCFASSIISKGFTGRHGRAYLVSAVITANIIHGKLHNRALQTGDHTVSDISCKICGSTLGWKYYHAEERGQRYKVGKYILETGRVGKVNYWDGRVDDVLDDDGRKMKRSPETEGWEPGWENLGGGDDEVEVDLADEEELEEMFAGSWNKEKVLKRRERRRLAEEARRKLDSNV